MAKLQNTFTTPEQSKRLLEIGVPEDSADCYHDLSLNRRGMLSINGVYSLDVPHNHLFSDGMHRFLPCWSVGRLMEIFDICSTEIYTTWLPYYELDEDYITYIMHLYERWGFDFSKLED